jgi:polyisoprenoid-binding protein YceI
VRVCAVLALLLAGLRPSTANALTHIDATRSHAAFELPLLLVGSVKGRFQQISGSVLEADGHVQVCAVVAVASAFMRRAKDREELLGPNFFNAAAFPQLGFVAAPLPRAALQPGAELNGKLSVRGISRPTRFRLVELDCPQANASAGCRLVLQGAIRRGDFGMRARRGVLGNSVALQLVIQLCEAGAVCAVDQVLPSACTSE